MGRQGPRNRQKWAQPASRRSRSSTVSPRDHLGGPAVGHEDHRRAQHLVVIGGHGVPVGAGDRGGDEVADGQVLRHAGVRHHDVPRFAVLAHHPGQLGPGGVGPPGQERLVAAAVEDRAGVVAHPPVHRHVGADARQLLDGAHPVEGEAGGGHDRASGFGRQAGAGVGPGAGAGLPGGGRPLGLGRGLLPVDVGHPQPPAHHQLGQVEGGEERPQHLGRLLEVSDVEHLAAYMGVHPHQLEPRPNRPAGGPLRPPPPTPPRSRIWSPPGRSGRTRGCGPRPRG